MECDVGGNGGGRGLGGWGSDGKEVWNVLCRFEECACRNNERESV